jgi:AcrR family transcriptional regulator
VSHAAPAHHFRDRAALLSALAAEGFDGLAAALDAATAPGGLTRLAAQGRAYVRYAVGAPGHFPVMFRPELTDGRDPELVRARQAAFTALDEAVTGAQREGWAAGASHEHAVTAAWSIVHGLATLWLDGALPPHLATGDADAVALAVTSAFMGPRPTADGTGQALRRETVPPIDTT